MVQFGVHPISPNFTPFHPLLHFFLARTPVYLAPGYGHQLPGAAVGWLHNVPSEPHVFEVPLLLLVLPFALGFRGFSKPFFGSKPSRTDASKVRGRAPMVFTTHSALNSSTRGMYECRSLGDIRHNRCEQMVNILGDQPPKLHSRTRGAGQETSAGGTGAGQCRSGGGGGARRGETPGRRVPHTGGGRGGLRQRFGADREARARPSLHRDVNASLHTPPHCVPGHTAYIPPPSVQATAGVGTALLWCLIRFGTKCSAAT